MSSTLFAAMTLLAPVHTFLRRMCGANARRKHPAGQAGPGLSSPPPQAAPAARGNPCGGALPIGQLNRHPPVRVMRLLEAGPGARHGGRMVISGRMADVCAELDRMVAREAAQHR